MPVHPTLLRRAPRLLATCTTVGILASAACAPEAKKEAGSTPVAGRGERVKALIARGDSLELPGGKWEPPPGDGQEHSIAGFATTLCAAVFITGLDPADAAANVGFFTGPLEDRKVVTDTVIDRKAQTVSLKLPTGVWVRAKRFASQGCIPLPKDKDSVFFAPVVVKPNLPDAATTPWPMGDKVEPAPWPAGVDSAKVMQALATGFGPDSAMTEAFLVTYKGRIIAERYGAGIGIHTPLESWSMGKSLTGTLVARLMGTYTLDQPAPIPEWQTAGDPRQEIRIMDIMRMSSGLRIRAPQDPDYDPSLGYPDHLWYYTGAGNSFQWAATRPQQWKPNTVGRYRNTDPVLANYLVRLGVEKRGEDYRTWPQRNLFDKIGIRDATLMTDPYGNNLTQGAEYLPARDWARLANLYVQDGMWNGERLLPEGYVDHVKTVAPAWQADGRPVYGGGFMWVNGDGGDPMPKDAFSFRGAGGQSTIIVPDRDLVVVRIGKYRGSRTGDAVLKDALKILMDAVPPKGAAQ